MRQLTVRQTSDFLCGSFRPFPTPRQSQKRYAASSWLRGLFSSSRSNGGDAAVADGGQSFPVPTSQMTPAEEYASKRSAQFGQGGSGKGTVHNGIQKGAPTENEIALYELRSHLSEIRKNPSHPHAAGPKRLEQEIALIVMLAVCEGEAERYEALGRGEGLWRVYVANGPSNQPEVKPGSVIEGYAGAMEAVCRKWADTVPVSHAASSLRMVLSSPLSLCASSLKMHSLATAWERRRSGAGEAAGSAGIIDPRAFGGEALPMRDIIMGGLGASPLPPGVSSGKDGKGGPSSPERGQTKPSSSPFAWSRERAQNKANSAPSQKKKAHTNSSNSTPLKQPFHVDMPISGGGQFGGGYGLDDEEEGEADEMDALIREKLRADGIDVSDLDDEHCKAQNEDLSSRALYSDSVGGSSSAIPSAKGKEAEEKYVQMFGKGGTLSDIPGATNSAHQNAGKSPMDQWRAEVANEHPFLHMGGRRGTADSGPRWS